MAIPYNHFERNKNLQALGITIAICAGLLLILFLVSWTIPQETPQPEEQGIEVNLGNSDQGLGDIAPQIPGEPSAAEETNSNPPPAAKSVAEPVESKEVAPNEETASPVIHTAPKPEHKPDVKSVAKTASTKKLQPVVNPTPAPPKPKALYKGGTSTTSGGNNADSYNGVKNQGIAGGNGDQGKPNGNPNSDSYTGNGGNGKSGVTIRSGLQGRKLHSLPSFQDDFNENAKVAVDITVNSSGTVTAATINQRGTTTTNTNIRTIAKAKAMQLKFTAGSEDQSGTIVFDFKLHD